MDIPMEKIIGAFAVRRENGALAEVRDIRSHMGLLRTQWQTEHKYNTYQAFCTERYGKNNKRQSKIEKALEKAQRVEPEFLDRLIGLYDRKNTSQKDKVYIVVELEKYYCEKTINFFKRIAHAEINFQLREESEHQDIKGTLCP